jgi:hypothetical protein
MVAGRALTWHDAFTRANVVVIRELRARVLEGPRRRRSAAGSARRRRTPLADDRGRRRRRPRERRVAAGAADGVLADAVVDQGSGTRAMVYAIRSFAVRSAGGIADAAAGDAAGRVGGEPQPALSGVQHARGAPGRVDGADVVRARDPWHRGGRGAPARHRRHLRRHLLRRDAAHAGDRDPHRARRRAAATSAACSSDRRCSSRGGASSLGCRGRVRRDTRMSSMLFGVSATDPMTYAPRRGRARGHGDAGQLHPRRPRRTRGSGARPLVLRITTGPVPCDSV